MAEHGRTAEGRRLTELGAELAACVSVEDVYDRAIGAAGELIEFDAAIVCTVRDGAFEPRAVAVDRLVPGEPLSVDDGIAGKTLRGGTTVVVDDLAETADAAGGGDEFRSVLSIPLADDGVVQFLAREPAAFTAIDRDRGELLAATVTNARDRVTSERALERERDRFAALFENVPDPAVQYRSDDGERVIESVNAAFVRVFGYDAAAAVGESIADLLVPDGAERPPELDRTPGSERRTDVEVVRETAAGVRPFLCRTVPVATGNGGAAGYLIYTDLTEVKARERELERKNERLDRFASIVSHDLRNPLNVADGYLDLIEERHPSEELEQVRLAHERMSRLIDDVLELAREGDVDATEPIDLETAARAAWESVETEAATLTVDATGRIEADRRRLQRLFENLFRNSVEHGSTSPASQTQQDSVEHGSTSPASGTRQDSVEHGSTTDRREECADAVDRGSTLHVRVEELPDGFAVEDDGPGIPPAERETILQPGHTSADGNTGLGLAIVARIARAHGWAVDVTDGRDGGARFEFVDRSADAARSGRFEGTDAGGESITDDARGSRRRGDDGP